jgi:hypothetical protein
MRIRASLVLFVAVAALAGPTGCAWKPKPPPPLEGWTPLEIDLPDARAWTRHTAVIIAHDPRAMTAAEFEARLREAPGPFVARRAGLPEVLDLSMGPTRRDRSLRYVDIRFSTDVPRRMRVAWYDSVDGLYEGDLIAPVAGWTSTVLSPFHDKVREFMAEHRPRREAAPPPEPQAEPSPDPGPEPEPADTETGDG